MSPSVTLDITAACQPHTQSKQSPIDSYYDAAESITLVGTPDLLQEYSVLGRLLLLGHVGATETFVRTILVGLINVCPLSRAFAGSHTMPFASVQYYDNSEVAFGLFDGISLAGGPEIRKVVKRLIDIDLPNRGAVHGALEKFDAVCHLRHAAVHAHGSIGTANAAALGVVDQRGRLSLDIDLVRLHEAAMICRSVAQELNQLLFLTTFNRWRSAGLFAQDYLIDKAVFATLYSLFRSRRDSCSRDMRPKAAYEKLLR